MVCMRETVGSAADYREAEAAALDFHAPVASFLRLRWQRRVECDHTCQSDEPGHKRNELSLRGVSSIEGPS